MRVDLRAVCLVREILAYRSGGLADTAYVMQGIGTAPLWIAGAQEMGWRHLDSARRGETIAAFALTEPETGSDVANITTSAIRDGGAYVLNGVKTFITNAGIADHYILIVRTGEAPGSRGLSAFLIDADTPGLSVEPQHFVAPHAGGTIRLEECRVPADRLIGVPGGGFKTAMATFDIFRASVGAAALGFGRRALDESLVASPNAACSASSWRRWTASNRSWRTWRRESKARAFKSIVRPGRRTLRAHDARARCRWPRWSQPKRRRK